jgi:cell division protein FtsB
MSETEVQTAAVEAPGLTQWQRVLNTFTAPSKTFEDIQRGNRSWWVPLILISVVSYLLFAVIVTRIGMQQVVDNQMHLNPQQEEKMAQLTPAQREMGSKISLYVTEGIFIASPAFTLAVFALGALGLMATINFGFGGRAKFGGIFCVWFYATLPSLIKTLLGIIVIYAGMAPESFNIKNFAPTNIGAFLNPLETNAALYSFATSIDVIQIWSMILLAIGLAAVAGVKRNSGYIAVFGWWVIFVLFGVGAAAIRG